MSRARWAFSKLRNDIYIYFKYCPLCFEEGSLRLEFPSTIFGKIHLICSQCGAKWHINYGKTVFDLRFKWAKLEKESIDGKGRELLKKKHPPEFWQRMALEGRKSIAPKKAKRPVTSKERVERPVIVKEKEIVKEVIVKIRCPYCQNLYDESLDKCPYCGGKR